MSYGTRFLTRIVAVGVALFAVTVSRSFAQFNLQAGSAGFVQLNSVNTAAGGALPVFDGLGRMIQSGGFYPQVLGINTAVQNVAGGLAGAGLDSLQVPANGNFGGGRASLYAQGGNGPVGIFSNAFNVTDNNPVGNNVASAVDFGGTADFVNAGGAINFFGGSFGTVGIDLTGKGLGSYGEFGIRGRIEVGNGVGGAFVAAQTYDSFLSYGFGVGAAPFLAASTSQPGFNQVAFVTNQAGTATVFRGYAFNNIAVGAGQTLRVTGALTIFGDPATVVVDTSQPTATVIQSSAPVLVPEPATLGLLTSPARSSYGDANAPRRVRQ